MATTYTAHILFAPTQPMSQVLVVESTGGVVARVVATYKLGAYAELPDAALRLAEEGWRAVGKTSQERPDYHLVEVEKLEER